MFLSPLGERLGEGVAMGVTPSPSLSPLGERSMKKGQPVLAFAFASGVSVASRSLQPASIASSARS